MSNEYLEMYDEFASIISDDETITCNCVLEILKKYSSSISVFDMMEFTSQVIEENKYVQESYRQDSQKSYIESFYLELKTFSMTIMITFKTLMGNHLAKLLKF